jgi:hypothetical protein
MALRLLPFRQYDENDVVNLFAFDPAVALDATTDDGQASQGSIVKVSKGNFNEDLITYGSNSYLGKTDYPFVGSDMYPTQSSLLITGCGASETKGSVLGVTLNQTAKNDENGEKLLYNVTKKEELQAVLPGQTVPVATKGIFTFGGGAFDQTNTSFVVGAGVGTAANGQITGLTLGVTGQDNTDLVIGTVLGTGSRVSRGTTDQFAGKYVVVKLG